MLISSDFITNSSASSYMLKIPNEITSTKLQGYIYNLPRTIYRDVKSFMTFSNKQKLVEFTQQKECDWISKVMGPSEFISLSKEEFTQLRRAIEEKNSYEIIGYMELAWGKRAESIKSYCSRNFIKMIYLEDD
jgi:hypothetical protein